VLSASTGGVPGWRRARRSVVGLTQSATHQGGGEKKVGMAALLDGEGAPGTSTAPGVALQLREGKERVRPYQI
jgi:hypothetical protein